MCFVMNLLPYSIILCVISAKYSCVIDSFFPLLYSEVILLCMCQVYLTTLRIIQMQLRRSTQ